VAVLTAMNSQPPNFMFSRRSRLRSVEYVHDSPGRASRRIDVHHPNSHQLVFLKLSHKQPGAGLVLAWSGSREVVRRGRLPTLNRS